MDQNADPMPPHNRAVVTDLLSRALHEAADASMARTLQQEAKSLQDGESMLTPPNAAVAVNGGGEVSLAALYDALALLERCGVADGVRAKLDVYAAQRRRGEALDGLRAPQQSGAQTEQKEVTDLTSKSPATEVGAFLKQKGVSQEHVEAVVKEGVDGELLFDSLRKALGILKDCGVNAGVRAKVETHVERQVNGGHAPQQPHHQQQPHQQQPPPQQAQQQAQQQARLGLQTDEKTFTEIHNNHLLLLSLSHAVDQWAVADDAFRELDLYTKAARAQQVLNIHKKANSRDVNDLQIDSNMWNAIVDHTHGHITLTDDRINTMVGWQPKHKSHAKEYVKKYDVRVKMERNFAKLFEVAVTHVGELQAVRQHDNIRLKKTEVDKQHAVWKTKLDRVLVDSKMHEVEREWSKFVSEQMDGKLQENTVELIARMDNKCRMLSASVIARVTRINAAQGDFSELRAQQRDEDKSDTH